jgi:short-subunit dehydrogenase
MARQTDLSSSRVLVTGASSGIGRSLAIAFASAGARVAIAARRRPELEQVADDISSAGNPAPSVHVVDLAIRGAAQRLADTVGAQFGEVDILVNNAGGGGGGLQWVGGDRDEVREIFEVNVWSPLALTSALVPGMRARRRGAVINVTSMAQVSTWPFLGHYAASKAALATFTETLALELIDSGVHVMQVIPGPVDTAVQGESRLIDGFEHGVKGVRPGSPDELARLVLRGLASNRRRVVYPRAVRPVYTFPGLVRMMAPRRVEKVLSEIDRDDASIRRSGSLGDELAREAREAWLRGERDFSSLRRRAKEERA